MAIPSISDPRNPAQVMTTVNQLVRQFDNTGTVTLANSATSTVVLNPKLNGLSKVVLEPRTLAAAGAVATTYVSSISDGQFVITHASATTTRTFDYVIYGV